MNALEMKILFLLISFGICLANPLKGYAQDIETQESPAKQLPSKQLEEKETDSLESSQQRSIYGRYDDSHEATFNVENEMSRTILLPRKDFKDRIENSFEKY